MKTFTLGLVLAVIMAALHLMSRESHPQGRQAEAGDGQLHAASLDDGLVGYWPFDGDAKDQSGHENNGRAFGVDFSASGRSGKPNTAARFDGIDDCIEVRHSDSLNFGKSDFSLAVWINLKDDVEDVIGDIASKFNDRTRNGFNFYSKASSAGYNSCGDSRHVHFGIDDAIDGPWVDCGKPWPNNTYVTPLTVFNGNLYAGIADALGEGQDACHVFRYQEPASWIDCGRVGDSLLSKSAYSMVVHNGELYCGTGRYDWVTVSKDTCDYVRVYRYAGGKEWVDCGQPGKNYRILCLASFKGELYCGTDDMTSNKTPDAGIVFRYAGDKKWEPAGRLGDDTRVFCMIPHNGQLYAANNGEVYRYEGGTEWTYVGKPMHNTQVHSLQIYQGQLYAGTWPDGYICRYDGGTQWTNCGAVGLPLGGPRRINEVNELTVYNGKLYAGVIPKGEVYRYEGGQNWTMVRRLVSNPDWGVDFSQTWARVPSLTEFDGRLFAATAACRGFADAHPHEEAGRVYATTAGRSVSYDHDLGPGWQHLTAVKDGSLLKLYINGRLESQSLAFRPEVYNLSNIEPLYIGFGAVDYLSGTLDDVRLYNRALSGGEVESLSKGAAK